MTDSTTSSILGKRTAEVLSDISSSDEDSEHDSIDEDNDYEDDQYEGHWSEDDQDEEESEHEIEEPEYEIEPEYEVEERTEVIQGDPKLEVKFRLHISKEEEHESWRSTIHISCAYGDKDIGHAFGRYIRRGNMRANFWQNMEEPSQGMSDLGFEIFDRYGFLQLKFTEHCVQRGTSAWGSELDFGPLFYVEYIKVTDKTWQRKGVGRAMINALIQKATTQLPPALTPEGRKRWQIFHRTEDPEKHRTLHILVMPGWLWADVEPEIKGKSSHEKQEILDRKYDSVSSFYRSIGFRRIGASSCFGLSLDPDHKSYAVALRDDFDPPTAPPEEISDDDDDDSFFRLEKLQERRLSRMRLRLPLHHAIITLSDAECMTLFQTFGTGDGAEWKMVDRSRKTLLHVAVCEFKAQIAKWLMENANPGQCLTSARNLEGYTPLEALQDKLETKRTQIERGLMKIDVSNYFRGFPPEAVACLSVLLDIDLQSPTIIERLKYGCTCQECVEGFMSPRLKLALLTTAEITHDMLTMEVDDGPHWCEWHESAIEHITPNLQLNFRTNKSLRQGFTNVFDLIATCLRSNTAPNKENVLKAFQESSEWPPVTRNFLQWGGFIEGKIEAVLLAVFERAEEQDFKAGDGDFEETFGEDVSKLKKCRNDHEFGFVALACGLDQKRGFF